ncbi:MAG: nickel pincer cofactor biosynthesis protein LarC [Candidatus Heimdallarchaeota archaeon]|nr:MAG: nickel pincer cofactor biosynthesis protein LarC [Candidatus Heimdallarchaeota archaeon]
MSLVIIDPTTSGAAGDLLIASLLDIKGEAFRTEFCQLFQNLLVEYDSEFEVKWQSIKKHGISGTQILTSATKKFSPQEMHKILNRLSEKLDLSPQSHEVAFNALTLLIEAEKKVHGQQSKSVHFHELALSDTIFDLIGFSYLWEQLGFHQMQTNILPIALGGGLITIAHGQVSVPSPATTEIIRQGNLLVKGGPIEGELLTPTGAAILASLKAQSISYLPLIHIHEIGRSFGTREYKSGTLTCLQIIRGSQPSTLLREEINILETNVDDVDGETLGYLFDILFEENFILDLTIINTVSKKNRPGFLIRVIVEPAKTLRVTKILTRELGTLGVRVLPGFRHIVPRKQTSHQIKMMDELETVHLKRGYVDSELISEKVEYDDLKRIAHQKGISLRETRKRILSEIHKQDENNA